MAGAPNVILLNQFDTESKPDIQTFFITGYI